MKHFYTFILLSLFVTTCLAQQGLHQQGPSISLEIDVGRRLYYGKEYFVPPLSIKGTRSFMDLNFVDDGTIVYEGVHYGGVMLMYDIVRDEVVIRDLDLGINICPVRQLITHFSINGYEFLQVFDDTEGLAPGFYYKVYDSENFTVYGARNKSIQNYASATVFERRVSEKLSLFFKSKDNPLFVPITGRRSLLSSLRSDRKEINRFLRGQRLLYRDNPETYVQSVLHFVDETKER